VIVSGPAGVGKTTVCERLLRLPDFAPSISATTRLPRAGERSEVDYVFMNRTAFERARQDGLFLEWACVYDNYYGTPRIPVEEKLAAGKNVVLNIDVQGAAQVREKGLPVVSFFLLPPSMDVLRARIVQRGADSPEEIERRLRAAERELARQHEYDFRIVNDDLDRTVSEIVRVLEANGDSSGRS
jgi:guanylate kinase